VLPSTQIPAVATQEPLEHSFPSPHAPVGYEHWVRSSSQVPAHALPVPAHGSRFPWGAPVTAEHTPSTPTDAQNSHCPVQALSQQLPSTQKPLAHSAGAPHRAPFGFFVHWLALHVAGATHSAFVVQLVAHASFVQA
jgi:hypothetical protein